MPVLESVVDGSINSESLGDWETCVNGASNRVDPNRITWMLEYLFSKTDRLRQGGAFQESAFLRLLNKAMSQNYRLRSLYNRGYQIVKDHLDHPYHKVRYELSKILSTVLSFDQPYELRGEKGNMGEGFPR